MFSMYNPNKLALNDPLEFNGFDFAIAYVYFLFPKTLKKKNYKKKNCILSSYCFSHKFQTHKLCEFEGKRFLR